MKIFVFDSISQIKSVWLALQNEADCYGFQTYEWVNHWYHTIGLSLKIKLCFVLVTDDRDKPLLLFPFGVQEKLGLSCLSFLDGEISDYNAPLIHRAFSTHPDAKPFDKIWTEVTHALPRCDIIHLKKLPEVIGKQANPLLHLKVKPLCDNSYSLSLDGTWEDYYREQVKKRIQADSRRQRKRLAKLGELRFVIAKDTDQIMAITETMMEQKERRYTETMARNIFQNSAYRDFYRQATKGLMNSGLIHLSALKLNDTILATHWGIIHGNRFYFLMPTYDGGEWKKYSPGRLLLEHLLEWCFNKKLEVFDFTFGEDAYKSDWCDHMMKMYEYLEINTAKGYIYYLAHGIKSYVRQKPSLYRRLRAIKSPL